MPRTFFLMYVLLLFTKRSTWNMHNIQLGKKQVKKTRDWE